MLNRDFYIDDRKFPGIIVRGAGDLATGVICRLYRSGFRVAALETDQPTVIRRTVALADTVQKGHAVVEGICARKFTDMDSFEEILKEGRVPIAADPDGKWINRLKPMVVVDATISKKNIGTSSQMAPVVIAVGPGYYAGRDVDAVVETKRGHYLGSVIWEGMAEADTGIPGNIEGYTWERVIHAEASGRIRLVHDISDVVEKGECLAYIEDVPVTAKIGGVLRGMIADGSQVHKGMKIADVDPRGKKEYCNVISDKARSVAGGVLEAMLGCLTERGIHVESLFR